MSETWEDVVRILNEFEQKFLNDPMDESLFSYFAEIRKIFENNKFENWQILAAQDRINNMHNHTKQLEEKLNEERASFMNKRSHYHSYLEKTK